MCSGIVCMLYNIYLMRKSIMYLQKRIKKESIYQNINQGNYIHYQNKLHLADVLWKLIK